MQIKKLKFRMRFYLGIDNSFMNQVMVIIGYGSNVTVWQFHKLWPFQTHF